MGICESRETREIARSREIDKQLHKDFMDQQKVAKLLLLGSGEAGKTTLLKQMKILHANGFSEQEKLEYREFVYVNIIEGMSAILGAMKQMQIEFEDPNLEFDADLVLEVYKRGEHRNPFCRRLTDALSALWADKALRERVLPKRNEFHLVESCILFLDSLDRITVVDYVPNVQDILNLRIMTKEIVKVFYKIKNANFNVFDVGGCRSERRKWIHCFDNVHAIIFLSAISEFDQHTRESPSTNRLLESMRVFRTICNSCWFIRTAGFILFLNKFDLFEQKIIEQGKTIGCCFKKYNGANTCEAQLDYISKKFQRLNKNPKKSLWIHTTCANDTNQIALIWNDTVDVIIQKILQNYGMC